MFVNRLLRRIFGLTRDEVTGEWRKLHNEELNDLYSSPNIFRVIKWRRIRRGMKCAWGEERRIEGFGGETWMKETVWETHA
jgi:PAS domain-containing protein